MAATDHAFGNDNFQSNVDESKDGPNNSDGPGSLSGADINNDTETRAAQGVLNPKEEHPDHYPDGGFRAWLCVLGAAASSFCAFGWIKWEKTSNQL